MQASANTVHLRIETLIVFICDARLEGAGGRKG
jgi:hypothetical protein